MSEDRPTTLDQSPDPRPTAESDRTDGGHSLAELRLCLTVPLLCDALDAHGLSCQSPRLPIKPLTSVSPLLLGRAKTTLWADMAHQDPQPYQLELAAIDSCRPDEVIVCAAGGSFRSGIWGELLTAAATNVGCVGVIVDGAIRDLARIRELGFPVYARGCNPYDSRNRQRVIDYDVPVEWDSVRIEPGDLIAADEDGIVVIPRRVEASVLAAAMEKVGAENRVRDAIVAGMSATQAFETFGVL